MKTRRHGGFCQRKNDYGWRWPTVSTPEWAAFTQEFSWRLMFRNKNWQLFWMRPKWVNLAPPQCNLHDSCFHAYSCHWSLPLSPHWTIHNGPHLALCIHHKTLAGQQSTMRFPQWSHSLPLSAAVYNEGHYWWVFSWIVVVSTFISYEQHYTSMG